MENEVIETIDLKNGDIVEISQDDCEESPRDWDNRGKMVCFHRRYEIGDKHNLKKEDFESWAELREYLIKNEKAVLIYPLFVYEHSGLSIKIGSFNGLVPEGHAYFDSGQVGFIYAPYDVVKKEFGKVNKTTIEKAKNILYDEVNAYNQFLIGDVYSYRIVRKTTCKCCGKESREIIDTCNGFYGIDTIRETFEKEKVKV